MSGKRKNFIRHLDLKFWLIQSGITKIIKKGKKAISCTVRSRVEEKSSDNPVSLKAGESSGGLTQCRWIFVIMILN